MLILVERFDLLAYTQLSLLLLLPFVVRWQPAEDPARRLRHNDEIEWRGMTINVHQAAAGEPVGLAETDGGRFAVRYGPSELGIIDHRGDRLRRPKPPPVEVWTTLAVAHNPTGPAPRQQP